MFRVFLGTALLCVLLLLGQAALGLAIARFGAHELITVHMLFGIFSSIFICLLHTVTMFHLIGSQKDLKEASAELPEFGEIVQAIRMLKRKIFPIATFAVVFTIAMSVSGGGSHTGDWPKIIHQALSAIGMGINLYAFWIEYHGVKANLVLINLVDFRLIHGKLPDLDIQEKQDA